MSGPFVYVPPVNPVNYPPSPVYYRNSPYLAPFYNDPNSPFIPPLSLSANPSPYASPYHSPNTLNSPLPTVLTPNVVPFPGSSSGSAFAPESPWSRERRISWNGGAVAPSAPNSTWLQPPTYHNRTRSDASLYPFQQPVDWHSISPYVPYRADLAPQSFIHPLLNAEDRRNDLILDLSCPQFYPMRQVGNSQTVPISREELDQMAFHPQAYGAHIVCELIPDLPIDIKYRPLPGYSPIAPPLKVGDILAAIWSDMQTGISQEMWASLDEHREHMISRAYTKRCKIWTSRNYGSVRNGGVKKIDCLLGKVFFRGLVRTGDAVGTMKMIVA
ncbi:hypothetical protein CVT25_012561 [Psilocybe cyanescens]|uniref:DUF6699 domain-containing protein n=1 Tax=Psilocybe cyanescens TaxID=93625 RepID=A0A409X7V3_PSICY|nr:hypothetical protein CVT25_012561 [Psilocybe cyanescens]